MHILEQYAVNCGAKISKPFILTQFYPFDFQDKYICLHAGSGMESKNYDYFEEVVSMIKPFLDKLKIKIVQIGGEKEKKINGCYHALGSSKRQLAYIISNSELYFGNDTMSLHFASHFQKKIVCVSSVLYESCFYPYWSNKQDYIIINSHRDGKKPSFSANENPKTINLINPEDIAVEILGFLNIKNDLKRYKTLHLGSSYYNKIYHQVPDHVIENQQISPLNIRMDLLFDEKILIEQLKRTQALITTNKPININILRAFKPNILGVNYLIDEYNDFNFVKSIKSCNIKFNLLSFLDEINLNKYKMNYMDYGIIHPLSFDISKIENKLNNLKKSKLFYKSNNFILSKGQIFLSDYDYFYKNSVQSFSNNINELRDTKILKEDPSRFIIFAIDN